MYMQRLQLQHFWELAFNTYEYTHYTITLDVQLP